MLRPAESLGNQTIKSKKHNIQVLLLNEIEYEMVHYVHYCIKTFC